jgi:metal-dependent amidase/aminoacylase/carboxypeptidase family protein
MYVNQAIARCVDRILMLPDPQQNQATHTIINVAMLQSGAVFNHKPESGWFSLDIRSMDNRMIAKIETDVRAILEQVASPGTLWYRYHIDRASPILCRELVESFSAMDRGSDV